MKVVCTQENLKRGLGITSRISSGSTTLPVLNNVLLKTDQGVLKLSSTNLEMGVNTWVRCKVEEQGGISVPAKTIVDLINNLPSDNITLSVDNNQLLIETSNYKTKVKGLAPDEFPLIPQIEEQNPVLINSREFNTEIDLAADELTSAMRTAGIFTQTGNNVSLEFEAPDKLTISSSSGDLGESKLEIPCSVTGQTGKIIFNHRYILDCLSTIGVKKVTFQIINENSPALLMSKDLPGYIYLVMPIKI